MDDINIGAISEALNNKVDLPTNPERAQDQIDYVVDFQVPTAANNYTWYRKYKSGWVEQGGVVTADKNGVTVNLPITMSNLKYYVNANSIDGADGDAVSRTTMILSANQIKIMIGYNSNLSRECGWEVKGPAAA